MVVKKVLILEDNIIALNRLVDIVKSVSENIEVLAFSSMDNIYNAIMEDTIDLFMVDVVIDDEPGDVSGIRFIDNVRNIPQYEFTPVIFTTSLEDPKMYAYSHLHSYMYIEKPYDPERIKKVVEQALRYNSPDVQDKVLYFRYDGVLYAVKCSDIVYAESVQRKMCFYRKDGKMISVPYKTCKQIIAEANYRKFVQCNRGTLLNWDYVEYVDIINNYIKMKSINETIEIGVTYKKRISEVIKNGL